MRHAKIFSILVAAILFGYASVSFYFLPLATFQGDLTRLALLPESLFGWTKPQPALDERLFRQVPIGEADVLIIGDSFSDKRVWQTALVSRGLKVHNMHWTSIHGICTDFMPWLAAQGFKGKHLIFESVERSLEDNVSRSVACNQIPYRQHSLIDLPPSPPDASFDVNHGNYAGKLSTALRTKLNALEYKRRSESAESNGWMLPNGVKMMRLDNGCSLFSHAGCNTALFLAEDKVADIDEGVLKQIEVLNARLDGITPIWVFVPNKSTAYLYPDKSFWGKAEKRFHAPNLLHMTQEAIKNQMVDLYPGNNTHFSTAGYLLMGELIYKSMQNIKPAIRK